MVHQLGPENKAVILGELCCVALISCFHTAALQKPKYIDLSKHFNLTVYLNLILQNKTKYISDEVRQFYSFQDLPVG